MPGDACPTCGHRAPSPRITRPRDIAVQALETTRGAAFAFYFGGHGPVWASSETRARARVAKWPAIAQAPVTIVSADAVPAYLRPWWTSHVEAGPADSETAQKRAAASRKHYAENMSAYRDAAAQLGRAA